MQATSRLDAGAALLPAPQLLSLTAEALVACGELSAALRSALAQEVQTRGGWGNDATIELQAQAHGYAWFASYVRALQDLHAWGSRLHARGELRECEALILQGGFGEYAAQLGAGLALSQSEFFRPQMLAGCEAASARFQTSPAIAWLARAGFAPAVRRRLAAVVADATASHRFGNPGHEDPALLQIGAQFSRYADAHAARAHEWHLANRLIPDEVIRQLAELGVFGLSVPEAYGGTAMDKVAVCVVTEALSRGHIALGSLGTRSEIAAELIRCAGTDAQKARLLPGIAAGTLIPTAAFTEPDVGSDLSAIKTRAVRDGEIYRIHGSKTWMTHGARSDLMTLLARTDAAQPGYRGLSMFLVEKPRGSDDNPFPAAGMSGSEIAVLGYRGMKEYEVAFDGYEVPASALLGGVEGHGFKQLMQTFESARIQTAARAVGVAQSALEAGMAYAVQRRQFGRALIEFPRVGDKLAWMVVETMIARQLTLSAARQKDAGQRCDIEAGMAKLLAARVAWSNADNAVQVHGGNGYALEYPVSRILCDARVLSIFEGAAEIQAQVIVRGLLGRDCA